MKIVYCINGTYNAGGMERVLANKVNYLVKLGHELIVVTTDQRKRKSFFHFDPAVLQADLGINYTSTAGGSLVQKLMHYPFKQRRHKVRLRKLLCELKADIVLSMFDPEAAFLYQIKDGSKKILEIHFSRFKKLQYGRSGVWGWINRYRSKQDKTIARKYDRFVVLTREDRAYWGNIHNIEVIPNANSFLPVRSAQLNHKQAIAVGRYDAQKGFEELIVAWKQVYELHPDWSLHIFGDGPLKDDLQTLIDRHGLGEAVRLCPPVTNIEQEYLRSSMLLMTSKYEGLPMALLEGQACGLPLIAYACKCGPGDIIQDGNNGYLLAEGDRSGLAAKLVELIEDPALRRRMGQASSAMSGNFSEEKVMRQWLKLFEDLTGKING